MDPIKNLVSGADPIRHHPAVPDGEEALRGMFARAEGFTDRVSPDIPTLAERRQRRARIAGLLAIAAAAVTAGVLVTVNLGPLTAAPAPATTVTPTANPTPATPKPTPTPTGSASSTGAAVVPPPARPAWTSYTDSTGQATFDIRPDWAVVESPHMIAGMPFNTLEVRNADNQTISRLDLVYDRTAGPCGAAAPFTVLDSEPVQIPQQPKDLQQRGQPRFSFTIVEGAKIYGSMALSGSLETVRTPCSYSNGIGGPEGVPPVYFGDTERLTPDGDRALEFTSVAEANAYMQSHDYADKKRMLTSLSLKASDVITSQRFTSEAAGASFALPTGWAAKDVPAGTPDYPASAIEVSDEAGKTVATFYHGAGGGLGGSCGPEKYIATELDSAQYMPSWDAGGNVRFSYRVLDQTSVNAGFSYQVGLVDEASGQLKDSCLMYSVVNGAPRGTLSFADRAAKAAGEPVFQTLAEAKAYMGTAEYRKLKEMILSLTLSQ